MLIPTFNYRYTTPFSSFQWISFYNHSLSIQIL